MALKILRLLIPLIGILLLLIPTAASALPSAQLFETYATGSDANVEVYGNTWLAQTFTVSPESHSVTQIRLLCYREGSPGTVTISIKAVDGDSLPTGADLTSATLNGNGLTADTGGAWYGVDVTEYSLDYNTVYGIVIRAEAGDADNSLHVIIDGSSAGYTGGSEINSATGGISWTADTDDDLYFEIRGKELLELSQAKVFRNYAETNDMLFVLQYYNTYTPYYPTNDSNYYFTLQLRAVGGATVIAQTTCRDWGYKPGAIYLNADNAAGLTPGVAYNISIYGAITEAPLDSYVLTAADWRGDDLTILDLWCITTAKDIAEYYYTDLTTYASGEELLNEEGGVIFAIGIPALQYIRPDIFQTMVYVPEYDEETWAGAYESDTTWSDQIGTTATTAIESVGDIFGLDGRNTGAFVMVGIYIAVILLIVFKGGSPLVAAALAIPIIILGTWLHLFNVAFIAIIAGIGILLMVYRFWWSRT